MDNINIEEELKYFQKGNMIRTFKTLQFIKDGEVLDHVNWRTVKAKELFCYLLHHKSATKQQLIELLWPSSDEDKALQNLYTTIYQIKTILKSIEFNIELANAIGRYELVLHDVKVDVDIFEKVFNNFEELTQGNYRFYEKLMAYYTGDYFKEEHFSWNMNKNESMKILYITMLNTMIEFLRTRGKYLDALLFALQIQEHYPQLQNNYFVLMQLYDEIGEADKVREQYRSLNETIGKKPNKYIINWYENWKEHNISADGDMVSSY